MRQLAILLMTIGLVSPRGLRGQVADSSQKAHVMTARVGTGPALAYGGPEEVARTQMASFGLEAEMHRSGESAVLVGFGFGYYADNHEGLTLVACNPGNPWCNGRPFPVNFRTASIDVVWRRTASRFSLDLGLQATAFTSSYPTRWAFGPGARGAVGMRLVGPIGFEVATVGAYTPQYAGYALGVRDLTFGFRSW